MKNKVTKQLSGLDLQNEWLIDRGQYRKSRIKKQNKHKKLKRLNFYYLRMLNNTQVKINKRQRNVSRVTVYEACPRQVDENEQETKMNNKISFDSDSFEIGVDNRAAIL